MPSLQHQIIARSRDRNFLLRWALIIVAAGVILGYALSHFGPAKGALRGNFNPFADPEQSAGPHTDFDFSPYEIPKPEEVKNQQELAELVREIPGLDEAYFAKLDVESRQIFKNYATALHDDGPAVTTATEALAVASEEEPPPRFANAFSGHLQKRAARLRHAADYFRREIVHFPANPFARRAEIACLLELDDVATLDQRIDEKGYDEVLDYFLKRDLLAKTGRWWELTIHGARGKIERWTVAWSIIALFAGSIWFTIVSLLGGIGSEFKRRLLLYGAGFALGVVSIFLHRPILIAHIQLLGLEENGEFINDAVFFISGVGLREEAVKLLLFVPLLPFLLKRRSSMEALAAAACVGLGFAVVENLGYTAVGSEGGLFGRIVTANFLHLALTGLAGLALFHFVRWPKSRWEELLATFVGVVVAHGLYDLFLSGEWSQWAGGIPPIMIFAAIVYRFLNTAKEVREGRAAAVSPLGVFVLGVSITVALAWMHACWHQPLSDVMMNVGVGALGVGVISFIFINAFRHE